MSVCSLEQMGRRGDENKHIPKWVTQQQEVHHCSAEETCHLILLNIYMFHSSVTPTLFKSFRCFFLGGLAFFSKNHNVRSNMVDKEVSVTSLQLSLHKLLLYCMWTCCESKCLDSPGVLIFDLSTRQPACTCGLTVWVTEGFIVTW